MWFGSFFFFNDTATTEIYTLSLHDALPISRPAPPDGRTTAERPLPGPRPRTGVSAVISAPALEFELPPELEADRKSTRLNSSHANISYAVFCLKKKKKTPTPSTLADSALAS